MKNLLFAVIVTAGISATLTSCRADENYSDVNQTSLSEKSNLERRKKPQNQVYQIRVGIKNQNGTTTLTGSYDMGNVYATNTATGQVYDESNFQYGGGFRQLPAYFENLPAGTYTFSADQGQGGWVGYGTTTVNLGTAQVGPDGYVNAFIPIAWAE